MRLCVLGDTVILCSPLFLLLLLFYALMGMLPEMLLALLALSLHELAHTAAARGLGYAVQSVALAPFGFSARLREDADGYDALCIAAAGPLFSLVAGVCCLSARPLGLAALDTFGGVNMAVGLLNLLPALPLDGGRILCALLFRSGRSGRKASCFIGMATGGALCLLGVPLLRGGQYTMLIMGAFLFVAALRELKANAAAIQTLLAHERRLRRGAPLPVRYIAVRSDMAAREALRYAQGGCYTVWQVLDDAMRVYGTLDEGQLAATMAARGAQAAMGTLVDHTRGTC